MTPLSDPALPDPDDDLPALRAPAAARRSDDAFARAVRADVNAARGRFSLLWLGLPSLAGAAAVVFFVGAPGGGRVDARAVYAAAVDGRSVAVFDDDDDVLAFADADAEDGDDFAIPGLAGSSDGELEDIEAALDRALEL